MKKITSIIGYGTVAACLFGLGMSAPEVKAGHLPSLAKLGSIISHKPSKESATASQVFEGAYHDILDNYSGKLDHENLKFAGMQGVMSSLGDPHTIFLLPKIASEFQVETRGNFVGIGCRLNPHPRGASIVSVFPDGPAKKAGLKGGDLIIGVDGKSTAGMEVDKIVEKIRGEEDTTVKLTVLRDESKQLILTIKRGRVQTPTVESKFLKDSNVGYLNISNFAEPTVDQFDREWTSLDDQAKGHLSGLVIDLRGNPGGLLESAVEMVSRFVENKPAVRMKFREGSRELESFAGMKHPHSYPIVLLINEDSASAAEIFAGNLHDYKLATLVGNHSYGKASVQDIFRLNDGAIAKITVAKYYIPSGTDIGRKVDEYGTYKSGGIDPDVQVGLDPDSGAVIGDPIKDPQLKKALEVIAAGR